MSDSSIILREAFERYAPGTAGSQWTEPTHHPNDLVYVDGNTAASSYLVISKCPLSAGTQTEVETVDAWDIPCEIAVGMSMSQSTLGQELSIELADPDGVLPDVVDTEIASISQTLAVLTIDTLMPHGLVPGKAIGVVGCSDSRANYPALVVASIPTPTQITVTGGPGGNIPSLTIANPVGTKGRIFFRERLGRAKNGVAQIFENASATQSSMYVRSESGDALPSSTIAAQHSVNIGSRASTQLVNLKDAFAFTPASEFRIVAQTDRVQWSDVGMDNNAQSTSRLTRTQVVPSTSSRYRLRFRANNSKSLTVPVAQIVSAAKTGTTTATVVCDRPHGLTLLDVVNTYGVRDQTNFANLITATSIASIVNDTTFTIVWGAAVTATTFGGYVSRVNGGNLSSALGATGIVAQGATLSTRVDAVRELTINGSGNWTGLLIGDLVDVVGMRNIVDGATLGVDGPWKISNIATTTLTLVPPFVGQREIVADFASVNCGGALIKRTDTRISFVRIFDLRRERVEIVTRPSGDVGAAVPVAIQNTSVVTFASGTVATDSAIGNPMTTGLRASNANPTAMSATGDNVPSLGTMIGAAVVKPYALPEAEFSFTAALTTTSDVAIQVAAPVGVKRHLTWVEMHNTGVAAVDVLIRDGVTTRLQVTLAATGTEGCTKSFELPTGIPTTAATALNVALSAAGTVRFNALGYTAP